MKTIAELEAQAIVAMQEKIDHLREELKDRESRIKHLAGLLENSLECVGWLDQRGLYYKGSAPPDDKNSIWRPVYVRRA